MHLTSAKMTDPGGRAINEDSIGVFSKGEQNCFVLCDGLGGHGMGDIASSLVTCVFENQFHAIDEIPEFMNDAFMASEDILMTKQREENARQKMKTTAVVVAADEKNAYIGHVGDSRAYVFRNNKVVCRTQDHSTPQMLALSGVIKESEIRNHPDRNILLRVLGVEWEDPMYELMAPIPLSKCQAFLLCSDGFWELIEEKEMCSLLKKAGSVEEWLDSMERVVRKNGEGRYMDNFSAIAVWTNQRKRFFL